jgi:hypothetical protein
MKIWKNLVFVVIGSSLMLIYSNCAKKSTSSFEQVSDGYILTANEKVLKNVQDNSDYGITFIDLSGQKADPDTIRKALSDRSKHSTVEGKATKVGGNKLRITTASKVTVDLTRPFGTFLGLNSKKLGDLLAGAGEGENCGTCFGVKGFTEVTCDDPNSIVCCQNCQ